MILDLKKAFCLLVTPLLLFCGAAFSIEKALSPGWNLISLPVNQGTSAETMKLFAGEEPQNPSQPSLGYYASRYVGIPAVSNSVLTPSEGHWVWAQAGWTLRVEGEPNQANPTLVHLSPGWNLVGNPFETPLSRSMVFTDWENGKVPQPFVDRWYVWEDGDYQEADTLAPWQGAWVLAAKESQLASFNGYFFDPKQFTRSLVSWQSSRDPNVVGYNVYKDGVRVNDGPVVQTSYMVGHLDAGGKHVFQIKAIDASLVETAITTAMTSKTFSLSGEITGVIGGRVMKIKTPNPSASSSINILEPVASASVLLLSLNQTVVTDAWGYFEFNQVPPGEYSLVTEDSQFGIGRGAVVVEGGKSVDAGPMVYIKPVRLAAGRRHACAIKADGRVRCWGLNGNGQLGNGIPLGETGLAINEGGEETEEFFSSTPVDVVGLTDVVSVGAGNSHTCALKRDGTMHCWGNNIYGTLLGSGSLKNSSSPLPVLGLSNVISFDVGQFHVCAVKAGGTVVCWGLNERGQLGDGTQDNRSVPTTVIGILNAISVAAGDWHTCVNLYDGKVKCWGNRYGGQLGDGVFGASIRDNQLTPVFVSNLQKTLSVDAGYFHACSLDMMGTINCWGLNGTAQLGDGTLENKSSPVGLLWGEQHIGIGLADEHSCGIGSDKTLRCWGRNEYGQLGNGEPSQTLTQGVVKVIGLIDVQAVAGGGLFTCAMKLDDSVYCWGYNEFGRLGNGNTLDQSIPIQVNW